MIYTNNDKDTAARVDSDRIARKFAHGGQVFVRSSSTEDRLRLIEFLESEGFCCVENRSFSRSGTVGSRLPLVIELNKKTISHMGNVMCAAAAAQSGVIMSDRDFYLLYSMYDD